MTRVVFVDREPASGFMRVDLRLLESAFDIDRVVYPGKPTAEHLRELWVALRRADAVYVFFGSEHALAPAVLAAILGRRFVLIPAGYDYANIPERQYGLAARGRGWLPILVGRLADRALPISKATAREFLALVPAARSRTEVAYLAVDPTEWESPGVERVESQVITVAYVDEEAWTRKGIDRFVECARRDPAHHYVLAGRIAASVSERLTDAPDNLEVTGFLAHDDLRRYLWQSSVYAQLSWHETFGVSMVEAMLCGCVPVITEVPALVEVAGEWAQPVGSEPDEVVIARAVRRATHADRAAMRAGTARRFEPSVRREQLTWALSGAGKR